MVMWVLHNDRGIIRLYNCYMMIGVLLNDRGVTW